MQPIESDLKSYQYQALFAHNTSRQLDICTTEVIDILLAQMKLTINSFSIIIQNMQSITSACTEKTNATRFASDNDFRILRYNSVADQWCFTTAVHLSSQSRGRYWMPPQARSLSCTQNDQEKTVNLETVQSSINIRCVAVSSASNRLTAVTDCGPYCHSL